MLGKRAFALLKKHGSITALCLRDGQYSCGVCGENISIEGFANKCPSCGKPLKNLVYMDCPDRNVQIPVLPGFHFIHVVDCAGAM
jgi:predicted amidophosphoribosyltransferase